MSELNHVVIYSIAVETLETTSNINLTVVLPKSFGPLVPETNSMIHL